MDLARTKQDITWMCKPSFSKEKAEKVNAKAKTQRAKVAEEDTMAAKLPTIAHPSLTVSIEIVASMGIWRKAAGTKRTRPRQKAMEKARNACRLKSTIPSPSTIPSITMG
jgi:hypothetical protein